MTKFACLPLSLARNRGLGSDAQVYLVLKSHADKTGRAWPKIETLANETELSQRTVQRSLRRLAKADLITIEPGTGHRSNLYTIRDHQPGVGVTASSPQSDGVDTQEATAGVTPGVTQRVTHNEPLNRPLKKDARARDALPDGRRRSDAPVPSAGDTEHRARVRAFRLNGCWPKHWGPRPDLAAAA